MDFEQHDNSVEEDCDDDNAISDVEGNGDRGEGHMCGERLDEMRCACPNLGGIAFGEYVVGKR